MRLYTFCNMYLSPIQNGIQTAHVVAEMFAKYSNAEKKNHHPLLEWASDHKTIIVLNAGYGDELYKLYELFEKESNPYPWAHFHESKEALDGAFTCIGILLPDRIYETAQVCRDERFRPQMLNVYDDWRVSKHNLPDDLTSWECELIDNLNNYRLA
jgi:peptidyl-tRNA hydrolase